MLIMAKAKSKQGNKTALTTSQSIQEQTEAFLQSGGEINFVKTGVTGLNYQKTSKHITISSPNSANKAKA